MTPKNIALEPELLERVDKLAQQEGKTADELANELLGPLVEIRKQADASDRRWRDLVNYGNAQAQRLGIKEEDVDRLIHEWRSEQRGR
jgi:predicted transcriptional regulator